MSEKITIENLREIADKYSMPDSNIYRYYRYYEGVILDPQKSAEWNKEEVERRNAEYNAEMVRLNQMKEEMKTLFYEKLTQYVIQELDCTESYAEKVVAKMVKISREISPDIDDCMKTICKTVCTDIIELIKDKE